MPMHKASQIIERFANLPRYFRTMERRPVFVYKKLGEDLWKVAYMDILLGIFKRKLAAVSFAKIVARTNNTVIHVYEDGVFKESITP